MRREWTFVLQWTLATAMAVVLANLIADILWFAVLGWLLFFFLPLGGVVFGLLVGICQWLVLRRVFPGSGSWILATSLGFLGAWMLGLLVLAVARGTNLTAFSALAGATPVIGLAQAAVLRRWTSRAGFWVLASVLGWSACVAVQLFGARALSSVSELTGTLVSWIAGYETSSTSGAALVGGVVAGGITGLALLRTLGNARSKKLDAPGGGRER